MYLQLLLAIIYNPLKNFERKEFKKKFNFKRMWKHSQKDGACINHGAMLPKCKIEGCNNQSQTGGICFNDGATCKNVLLKDVIMYQ